MNWKPERELGLRFQIDTNRINARAGLENMNRLEAWAAKDLIEILISEPARGEVLSGENAQRAQKVGSYVFTMTIATEDSHLAAMRRIERILFPDGARNDNQRHDVEIVFNAQKYGAGLITSDGDSKRQPGGILGAKEALAALDIHVMNDAEAVGLVEERIRHRDELVRHWASITGQEVPSWVGADIFGR